MSEEGVSFDAEGFDPKQADFHRKTENKAIEIKESDKFEPTNIETIMKQLRDRDNSPPIIIEDGLNIIKADILDYKALDASVVNHGDYAILMEALGRIRDTMNTMNKRQLGEDIPPPSYDDLSFALSYFRVEGDAMQAKYICQKFRSIYQLQPKVI